jgi:MoxR-like ATPase
MNRKQKMNRLQHMLGEQNLDQLQNAINALQPREQFQAEAIFSKVYPLVEQALARGVTQKSIIDELKSYQLKLHAAKFKELLERERVSRDVSGNRACCATCGAKLPLDESTAEVDVAEVKRGEV